MWFARCTPVLIRNRLGEDLPREVCAAIGVILRLLEFLHQIDHDRVTGVVRANDLNQQALTKALNKLLDEAHAIAALEAQVPEAERDTDRAAANAVIRVLRFARTTDQTPIEAMIALLSPK